MAELKKYKLSELCKLSSSKRIFESEYVNNGIPFIRGQEISDKSILDDNAKFECYISEARYNEIKEKYGVPQKGDILMTAVGTIGNLVVLTSNRPFYFKDGNVIRFSDFAEMVDSTYLSFFMKSPYFNKQIEYALIGAVQKALTMVMLSNIEIPLPDIIEQKCIAKVLSDIEHKISVNCEINRNLEELAKQIYDYWFVQFDFPSSDSKPYKSSGGKMTFNPILKKDIPEGWEVKPIASQIKYNIGGDWGKEKPEGNYQLKVSCCRGADIVSMTDLPNRYILNANSSKLLKEDDMIVEISGGSPTQSTGRCVLISKEILNSFDNKLICSNFCQALSISDKDYVSYFYHMWKMFYDSNVFFNFEGKTSGIKNFQYDTFVAEKWYFPPKDLVKKFGEIVSQNYKKKCALEQENKHLAALRDKLLPILMNGQVRVE